jgi:hypothetical protein
MKWYAYPLALVAWLLVAIWIFIFTWNYIGDAAMPTWHYWMLVIAGSYLVISVALARIKMSWELDAFIQVVFVLAPLLWYLNLREPYKPPVYVFLIDAGFEGDATVSFAHNETQETMVRSTEDTLYFKFDGDGTILLNEDFRTVREAISSRFYFLYPDGSQKKIQVVAEGATVQPDSTVYVAFEDTMVSDKGNIQYISWKISRADRYKGR